MFSVTEIPTRTHPLQLREEFLTGHRCKISPERLNRGLDTVYSPPPAAPDCPFCGDRIFSVTPTFPGGKRICIGESVTFPNLFPFAEWHTVTVITKRHHTEEFSVAEIRDALAGQIQSLADAEGYKSINWNYLPSAGASIAHPHLQGLADRRPPYTAEQYLIGGLRYLLKHGTRYWDDLVQEERESPRYLFDDELFWYAHHVPLGEREVRCIIPASCTEDFLPYLDPFVEGLLRILQFYRSFGTHAFNMSLFFDRSANRNDFSAFCSVISRINPNAASTSDSAFMERLHGEPVILTLPEEFARNFRNGTRV
jgi:UDPglucose--hexose-1-phosphate uridylyltransferase